MKRNRVIFDHLLKTGGQTLNRYLSCELGPYFVTPNIEGYHRELISKYGGDYSVISAHVEFDGRGLDPRYDYITVLRDPVERVLSWVHFVRDVVDSDVRTRGIQLAASEFISSDGDIVGELIVDVVSNYYVRHFQSCVMLGELSGDSLSIASDVLSNYEMILFTEGLDDSAPAIVDFFGFGQIKKLVRHNENFVSDKRFSRRLVERVERMNQLDVALYATVRAGDLRKSRRVYDVRAFMHSTRVAREANPHPISTYWIGWALRKYLAADLVVSSGSVVGTSVVGNGECSCGYMISGPFLYLSSGSYILVVHAILQKKHDGILIHVAGDAGRAIFAEFLSKNESDAQTTVLLSKAFRLDRDVGDLEVKIAAADAREFPVGPRCDKPQSICAVVSGDDFSGDEVFSHCGGSHSEYVCAPTIFSISILDVQKIEAKNREVENTIAMLCNCATPNVVYSYGFCCDNTEVGVCTDLTIESTGLDGLLLCRCLMSLRPARYQVFLFGEVGPSGLAGAALLLKQDNGRIVVQTKRLRGFLDRTLSVERGLIAEPVVIDIEEEADDFEICIYVTAQSEVSLRNVSVVKL